MFKFVNKLKNKKGFTLVELIIVLAVLGIIAAIAVPRFAKVQDQAKIDADIAAAKNIAKAAEMYLAQVDGNLNTTISPSALVSNGYLDEVPKSQCNNHKNKNFTIDIDANGKITVEVDNLQLYPEPSTSYK